MLHLVDGCTPEQFHEERYDLLKGAIAKLTALENTKVYLDAGNAGWGHPDQIFEPLKWAGIDQADGFAVNVSNFYTTEDSIAYGKQLSAKVGGKHFVIDTSRNGNGPYTEGRPGRTLVQPRPSPRRNPDDEDRRPPRGRLPVGQAPRGVGRRMQGRPEGWRVVVRVRLETGRGNWMTPGSLRPKGREELRDQPRRTRRRTTAKPQRYGTCTHSALEGVPSPSVTNIMYQPD